jgi:hypothetical protein
MKVGDQVVWGLRIEQVADSVIVRRPREVALLSAEPEIGSQRDGGGDAARENRAEAGPPVSVDRRQVPLVRA